MRWSSTRQAIHDASIWPWLQQGIGMMGWARYQCKIDRTAHGGSDLRCQGLVEAAYIMAAVNNQRPPVAALLRYVYACDNTLTDRLTLASYLFIHHFNDAKRRNRHKMLAWLAVKDYQQRIRYGRSMAVEQYAQAMGINASHWARDWRAKHDMCLETLSRLEATGLANVSMVVKHLREGPVDVERTLTETLHHATARRLTTASKRG